MSDQSISISPITKYFYLISGFILVAVGIIGIFLPLLPTTIFLILASVCFLKSSPKANEWLRNHKILGVYIDNYQNKTGLTRNAKIANIITLWTSISLSAFLLTDELYIRIILLVIAIGVTIHLLMIKTKRPNA
ncbi:MAG: YbaN family protein [Ignavibacterium sp.]|jgi:hypothetical protein|nr:YbaN family protein [Ignavibacterium sp.]